MKLLQSQDKWKIYVQKYYKLQVKLLQFTSETFIIYKWTFYNLQVNIEWSPKGGEQ